MKTNFRWIIDLDVKGGIIKLLEILQERSLGPSDRQRFFKRTQKPNFKGKN